VRKTELGWERGGEVRHGMTKSAHQESCRRDDKAVPELEKNLLQGKSDASERPSILAKILSTQHPTRRRSGKKNRAKVRRRVNRRQMLVS